MKLKYATVSMMILAGCASNQPRVGQESIGREVVVASMNDDSMPSWARKASERSLYEEDGHVISVSMTSLPGDSRIDAGFKIGELNAKAALAKTLETRIETFTQLADEGTGFDGQQLRSITTETAKITAQKMKPNRKFYQKIAATDESGVPRIEFRFWTEVTLSKDDFHKAMLNAAKKATSKPLSEAFAKQVDKNFERLVNGDVDQSERSPAHQGEE